MDVIRVLIVEDETVVAMDTADMLEELGYDVCGTAVNYREALDLLQTEKPDLILCDINLGGAKDGVDLAQMIRNEHHIPLIFSTSHTDKTTVKRAASTSPNGYLVKPYEKDDLYTAIEIAMANFSGHEIANQSGFQIKDSFFVKTDRLFVKVKFDDINWLQADSNYIKIYTTSGRYMVRMSFRELLAKLPAERFFQTHKSYYINLEKLGAVNSTFVLVENQEIPLSRNYKDDLLVKLNKVV